MPAKPSTKKVRHVNGSQKGGAFEREVAKMLSLWLSYGADPNLFWRTAGSGGRSTQFAKKNKGKGIANQASDISAQGKEGMVFSDRYIVECKFYKDIALWQLFFEPKDSVVGRWWAEATHDAESVGKRPLLIVRGNLLKPLLVIKAHLAYLSGYMRGAVIEKAGFCVYLLSDFLRHVTPHAFLDIVGEPPCRIRPTTPSSSSPTHTSPTTRKTSTAGKSSTISKRPVTPTASKPLCALVTLPTKKIGTRRS